MAKTGPGNCSVCRHDKRHQIEIGLVAKVPATVLAARFQPLTPDAILRHARNHLSEVQRAAILAARKPTDIDLDALRTDESEGLLAHLVAQRARLAAAAELALNLGDVNGSIRAESAITSNLKLVATMLGQLAQVHDVRHSHSLLVSPDYLRLRQALVTALRPFPEAAKAVGAALHLLESEAARDITAAASKGVPPPMIEHSSMELPAAPPPPPVTPPPVLPC